MVLSDGVVHFLKIEKFLKQIYQNYLVALMTRKWCKNSKNTDTERQTKWTAAFIGLDPEGPYHYPIEKQKSANAVHSLWR